MSKPNKSYTDEFKEEAIKMALNSSAKKAAENLNIPLGTINTWLSKAKKSGQAKVSNSDGTINHVNVSKILEENQQLKKKLNSLEQEKAILKKAATYFAKELE